MNLIQMDKHTKANVMRVLRRLGREWGMYPEQVYRHIQQLIDESWTNSMAQGNEKKHELWLRYFPNGKPTVEEYFIWYAGEQEAGRQPPYLL